MCKSHITAMDFNAVNARGAFSPEPSSAEKPELNADWQGLHHSCDHDNNVCIINQHQCIELLACMYHARCPNLLGI